jgi:hypothetical protein
MLKPMLSFGKKCKKFLFLEWKLPFFIVNYLVDTFLKIQCNYVPSFSVIEIFILRKIVFKNDFIKI